MRNEIEVYYVREDFVDRNGNVQKLPVATVAVKMNDDGTVNRGVAICSRNDHFVKEIGRSKAIARMEAVEVAQRNLHESNEYTGKYPMKPNVGFKFLGEYRAQPTKQELRMFIKPE